MAGVYRHWYFGGFSEPCFQETGTDFYRRAPCLSRPSCGEANLCGDANIIIERLKDIERQVGQINSIQTHTRAGHKVASSTNEYRATRAPPQLKPAIT